MNSLTFDWLSRRYVELHLNFYVLNMLCLPPQGSTPWERIGTLAARLSCVDERFVEFATEAGRGMRTASRRPAPQSAGGDRRPGSPRLRPDRGRTPLHLHRLHRKRRPPRLPPAKSWKSSRASSDHPGESLVGPPHVSLFHKSIKPANSWSSTGSPRTVLTPVRTVRPELVQP